MFKRFVKGTALAAIGLVGLASQAFGKDFLASWSFYGRVHAVTQTASTIYAGGDFTQVGPATGSAVFLDLPGGNLASDPYLDVTNGVSVAIPDNAGGWYIGGEFRHAGGQAHPRLAHILANGSIDPLWAASADNEVTSLALDGSTLYAGGSFSNVNGVPRNYLAALDAATGSLKSWNPAPNNYVSALTVSAGSLYVGGQFSQIAGVSRTALASFDTGSGALNPWNPSLASSFSVRVLCLAVVGSKIHVGGNFSQANGSPRSNLAAFDAATGALDSWDPGADSDVVTLKPWGSLIYAGGYFYEVGGLPRNGFAVIDASTGAVTPYSADLGGTANAIAISGTTLFLGGDFATVNGQRRYYLAALDLSSGALLPWDPGADNIVRAMEATGSRLLVGGEFSSVSLTARMGAAAFDRGTFQMLPWDPQLHFNYNPEGVRAILPWNNSIFLGGDFDSSHGVSRGAVAQVDEVSGLPTGWNPTGAANVGGQVRSLAQHGGKLFAVGTYYLAAYDILTGLGLDFGLFSGQNPYVAAGTSGYTELLLNGDTLYVAAKYGFIGSSSRYHLAAIDANTGTVLPFDAGINTGTANDGIQALVLDGNTLYLGGKFGLIQGQSRKNFAAVDAGTGTLLPWNFPVNGWSVLAMALEDKTLRIAGQFTDVAGQSRNSMAALDTATSSLLPEDQEFLWSFGAVAATIYTLAQGGDGRLFVGGEFLGALGHPAGGLAILTEPSAALTPVSTPSSPSASAASPYVYPAPASGGTATFAFLMKESGTMKLTVWDAGGNLVSDLQVSKPAGTQTYALDTSGYAPGNYFYRVELDYNSGAVETFPVEKFSVLP